MLTADDIYREVLWRAKGTTNELPYAYSSGGDFSFLQLFKEVYCRLVNEVVMTDSDFFLEKASANLVADTEDYYFPNDLIRLRYMELAMDGTNFYKAIETDPAFFATSEQALVSATSQSYPKFWMLGSTSVPSAHFQVAPRPRNAVTNGIKYYYDRMPSAMLANHISAVLSAASCVVLFPAQFEWLIPLGCNVELWGRYGLLEDHQVQVQKYERGIEDLKRLTKPKVSIGQKRIRDSREVGR